MREKKMKIKIELNGKGFLAIVLLTAGIVMGNFVSVVDAESNGGVTVVQDTTPVGTIAMWGKETPPTDWIELNGQSTSGYPKLTEIYGSHVPDFRGEFIRGWDNSRGKDSGRSLLSSQTQSIQSHNHMIPAKDVYNTGAFIINDSSGDSIVSSDNASTVNSVSKNNRYYTETAGETETRPENISVMYIVKAK